MLKYKPSKVIFFCGGNDLWAGKSFLQVKKDFDNFRKRLFERVPDAELIVLGVRPSPRRIAIIDKELKMNAVLNNVRKISYVIRASQSCSEEYPTLSAQFGCH